MILRLYGNSPFIWNDKSGERYTLCFQGCLHHCEKCINSALKPIYGGYKVYTDDVKNDILNYPKIYGISFEGGEPFLQPAAALELARFAKSKNLSVWCYTGYDFNYILEWQDDRKELLRNIDVLGEIRCDPNSKRRLFDAKASLERKEIVLYDTK